MQPNSEDAAAHTLRGLQDGHYRNAGDGKEIHSVFDEDSVTFISDLSLSALHNMHNQIHTSHQNLTFSFHFSLFMPLLNIPDPHSSSDQPPFSSVQLFGDVKKCQAFLTGVRVAVDQVDGAGKEGYIVFNLNSVWVHVS